MMERRLGDNQCVYTDLSGRVTFNFLTDWTKKKQRIPGFLAGLM